MIELRDVTKAFNHGRPNELWAVRGISLVVEPRRLTVLKGPSGSGKTTLLSMIGCLSRPTAGRITLDRRPVSGLPERFATQVRRESFGFVFQQLNLVRGLSVLENVMLPAFPTGRDYRALRRAARALLDRFGIAARCDQRVELLSGGEAQRTAICRALINDPRVLIADEPTANLDSSSSKVFLDIANDLVAEGKTVLVSSHDPAIYDSPQTDRVVEVHDGLLVDDGTH
jgi:putative ABC transport system ATP-binding protein